MRIAFHTQYYPPEMGAPQARISGLVKAFVTRGHDVFVITAVPNYPQGSVYDGYSKLYQQENMDGASVFRSYLYPTKDVRIIPRMGSYLSFSATSLITGIVQLPRVDYVFTESPPLFLGPTGFLLSRLKSGRWIFNVSDLWPQSAVDLGLVRRGMLLRAAEALEAFCYRNAWLVTGQSREILASIGSRFPKVETYHLSNGVDAELFQPSNDTRNGSGCRFVYAGLHGVAQGLEHILDAAV